jgi:hypothetical protein
MAESDTILQLGIEAAREGNREEARNLFGLLTRQEPNNAQAWLWLAGVAEGPEQRRAALERVVELDPTNEMAVKGLQAMGVKPTTRLDEDVVPADAPPPATSAPARELTDEERYALELDSAFDDYDSVPTAEAPGRVLASDIDTSGETVAADRPAGRTTTRGSARERSAARRASTPVRSGGDDDEDYLRAAAPRRGLSPLMLGLIGLIVAVVLCIALYPLLAGRLGGGGGTAGGPSGTATAQAIAGAPTPEPTAALPGTGGTGVLTPTSEISSTGTLTPTTDITSTGTLTPTTAPEQPAPAPAGGAIPPPSANPNLQLVDIGVQLSANGWSYTYPNANYTLVIGKQAGGFTAQGNYIHVLAVVANNTGTDQPLPANFFALKDAQGNVYPAQPQVSSALVQRGVNADKGMEDPIPANGVQTSVYLVFDVPSGAQNLTLFAAGNNGQGWLVLNAVP